MTYTRKVEPSAPWPKLEGERLILTPTTLPDAEELRTTVDERTFTGFLTLQPHGLDLASFTEFVGHLIAAPGKAYTMRLKETGEVVGSSSFYDIREPHRGLEIGMTWIVAPWRGTYVNPSAKLLMLGHAFEAMGMLRVQLKCDSRNERSAAAMRKLGAQYEGRLRKHGVLPDGYVRDTLMFSVTDDEWPQVRDGLKKRLLGLT